KNPSLLDVFINNTTATPDREVQLSVLNRVEVNGLGGDNRLIVDSSNGTISIPGPVSITFDGGDGDHNRGILVGGGTANITGPTNGSGSALVFKDRISEKVTFQNVEGVDNNLALTKAQTLDLLRGGLRVLGEWSSFLGDEKLLGQGLAPIGRSLGRSL